MRTQWKKRAIEGDHFQSNKTAKAPPNVKTVSIFISNLDKQIDLSYAKLRKNKERLSSSKKQSFQNEDTTLPCAISSILYKTQQSRLAPQSNEPITLLDNKQVMQYVHLVYDLYNIKDPLKDEENERNNMYMTNYKIRNFKDKCQRQTGSATTMKNSEMFRSIELNPFTTEKKGEVKKEGQQTARIQIISLNSQSRHASKQKSNLSESSDNRSTFRFKNTNIIPKKQKISLINSHRISHSGTIVPQLFRFCFMCEEPILDCNLQSHQQVCLPLKEAMNKPITEIIMILDEKIHNLTSQINHSLLEKSQQKIKEQFKAIKSSVNSWIVKLPANTKNIRSSYECESNRSIQSKNWRGQFDKIQKTITNSVCSSFHLIHKLQWFSKLRENIDLKFLANQ